MDNQEALAQLYDQARSLKQAISDIETTITTWLPRLEAEANAKRIISFLKDRYSAQRELIYELGTTAKEIQALERNMREHDARGVGRDSIDHENPLGWLELVEPAEDGPPQDHLDWFRKDLAENPPSPDEPDVGEQPGQLEPSPDDLLAWLPGRGRFR
ncbi:hypothetical protein [Mesorhizobium abyssinicae]|uniref:hypothetical protein n=1 Tax=Mesorhizobium abyssinicae TaxID=1209958 RepID=UPI00339A5EA7